MIDRIEELWAKYLKHIEYGPDKGYAPALLLAMAQMVKDPQCIEELQELCDLMDAMKYMESYVT